MRGQWVAAGVAVAVGAGMPWFASDPLVQFGINALLLVALAQGWNILGGFTGYASFGNSAFYGVGTYATAIMMVQFGWPFWAGLAVAALCGALAAVLFGVPILRLRGPYFAIGTLGLSAVMGAIASNLDIAGRNIGLILPLVRDDTLFFELALGLAVCATLVVFWVSRSRFGMGLIAIRENEDAAAVMGINTTAYKVAALGLASVISALAGGIHAYWITFIDPGSAFDPTLNVKMVIMTVFGGPGTLWGPVLGALILSAISETLAAHVSTLASLFYGLVIVTAIVFMPRGLMAAVPGVRRSGPRYFFEAVRRHRL